MRSSIIAAAACAVVVNAVAINQDIPSMKRSIMKRQSTTVGAPDDVVLNVRSTLISRVLGPAHTVYLQFALTLEHLENAFYTEGLAKYSAADFDAAGFTGAYPLLQKIAEDEASHVAFLTGAIEAAGVTPGATHSPFLLSRANLASVAVQACNYTFPYDTVGGFLALS